MPKDWRGTEINIGDTVIYGSGVGQSIQLNEAIVESFGKEPKEGSRTPQRVNLRIVRRSYMLGTKEVVSVGSDRMTIVTELPPTELLTQSEKNEAHRLQMEERERIQATHTRQEFNEPEPKRPQLGAYYSNNADYNYWLEAYDAWSEAKHEARYAPCLVCGVEWREMGKVECK